MLDFEDEIKLSFLNEADDSVQEGERLIIALERDEDKASAINELFRIMHNFKGSSAGVGFKDLATFTHFAESFLLKLKSKKLTLTPKAISLLLRCIDHLSASIGKLRVDLNSDVSNPSMIAELEQIMNEGGQSQGPVEESGSELAPELSHEIQNEILNEVVNEAHLLDPTFASHKKEKSDPGSRSKNKGTPETIRVPLPKIEQLLNEMGELVILQTVMSQNRKTLGSAFLKKTVLQMEKIIRNVQANSMSLRMLSLKPQFQKLERIVRDTSILLGKEIEFKSKGEDNEIDKTMLEQISDPLVHVIRNSVDHGIESPEERAKLGKPRVGRISMSAYQQGDQMVIEISDDGKGLDPELIRASAIKKGLISPDLKMTDEEARKLIFLPGFSTKSEVTDISGRGVGMDVVQTNITELRGQIKIQSEVGKGTTLQIMLPLTLAIIEGVVVQISDQRFIIPLSNILEYHLPKKSNLTLISERGEVLLLRGESIPVLRMDRMIRTQRKVQDVEGAPLSTVIIVHTNNHGKVALMVDRILRQQQVVIKQLSQELQGFPGIMGGAVLGDGRVAMVLDVLDWVDRFFGGKHVEKSSPLRQKEIS